MTLTFRVPAYSAAFPSLNMMSGISNLHEGISQLDPYKSLMERMKDEERTDPKESEEKSGSERKDLGPMPFSILPPHMLNMMERMKSEGGDREREERESSPINLSSEREEKRMSEGRSVVRWRRRPRGPSRLPLL